MEGEVHTLHFTENETAGEDPVARLDEGIVVFPHKDSSTRIQAGETWQVRIERRGTVAFAHPIARLDEPEGGPRDDPEAVTAFLATHLGEALVRKLRGRMREELEDEVAAKTKGRVTEVEKRMSDLEEKLGELKVGHRRRNGEKVRPKGAAKRPTLEEGEVPDEGFIERKILYQLYRLKKWQSTHTSGEKFQRGELSGVPKREIQEVVDALVAKRVLIAHGKRPDEEYSLNPARAEYIYQRLGVKRDRSDGEGAGGRAPSGESVKEDGASWVEEGTFENTMRKVEEKIGALRRRVDRASRREANGSLEGVKHRIKEVEGRVSGLQSSLNKVRARVEEVEASPRREDERASKRQEEEDPSSGGVDRVPWHLEADAAAAVPAIASSLGVEAQEEVRGLVYAVLDAGYLPPLSSVRFGVGQRGVCVAEACEEEAVGVLAGFDVTPGDPRFLAAPACQEHVDAPPVVVLVEGGLNRETAKEAVENLCKGREVVGLPKTRRLSTNRIQFHGEKDTEKHWNLAARRRR